MLKHQQGLGLIEVLVALLLLSVAVLGFSALQMRAIQATDETLIRSDAMVIIRNLSEDMRLLPSAAQKNAYIAAIGNGTLTARKDCTKNACDTTERMNYNVVQMKELAQQSDIKLNAAACPGLKTTDLTRVCIVAAWNDTEASFGGKNACTDTDGAYIAGSSCIVMETY